MDACRRATAQSSSRSGPKLERDSQDFPDSYRRKCEETLVQGESIHLEQTTRAFLIADLSFSFCRTCITLNSLRTKSVLSFASPRCVEGGLVRLTSQQEHALLQAIKDYENNKWKVIGQKVGKPAKVGRTLGSCKSPQMVDSHPGVRAVRQG